MRYTCDLKHSPQRSAPFANDSSSCGNSFPRYFAFAYHYRRDTHHYQIPNLPSTNHVASDTSQTQQNVRSYQQAVRVRTGHYSPHVEYGVTCLYRYVIHSPEERYSYCRGGQVRDNSYDPSSLRSTNTP